MSPTTFSVLIPTHNRLELLSRAIETVRRQDYPHWEIVVSDNFSHNEVSIYVKSLGDSRIKYIRTDKFIPVTENWNNALNHSTGDYIIMLGDDDCLLNGYFSTLNHMIDKYNSPDFIYTGALLYAYPKVIPGCDYGFLRSYQNRRIYQGKRNEFLLNSDEAKQLVMDSMDFRVEFDYNMQFSLVSRKLVEKLKEYGPFYQSPYPDYYASNAIMLLAERILVVPASLVTIGISPKSFGFYYFNDAEDEGNKFLNNLPDKKMVSRLQKIILPGPTMNTSWLIAMETLAIQLGHKLQLKPNYKRYRLIQILSIFSGLLTDKPSAKRAYAQLKSKMTLLEWQKLGIPLLIKTKFTHNKDRAVVAQQIQQSTESHPSVVMPEITGDFQTILDVFEQAPPKKDY